MDLIAYQINKMFQNNDKIQENSNALLPRHANYKKMVVVFAARWYSLLSRGVLSPPEGGRVLPEKYAVTIRDKVKVFGECYFGYLARSHP